MTSYEKLLRHIYDSPKKAKCLKIIGSACVYTIAAFFCLQLLYHLLTKEFTVAIIVATSALVGYVAVTVARRLVNAKRPYEVYDFYEVKPKDKSGEGFPSRHCYSAFSISTLAWLVHPAAFAALTLLSILIAVTRVLLGIHFIRDVAVGAACGVIFGVLGVVLSIII